MNIIIVDDEITALHSFLDQILLESKTTLNYKFFKNDEEAIMEYVHNNKVACAFLDINMGILSGYDIAKEIIAISKDTKIVFVTGYAINDEDIPTEISENVLGIVSKPLDIDKISPYLMNISNEKNIMNVTMFPHFDCYINDRLIVFSSSKSKELFAYLLINRGKSISMEEAITALWPDKEIEKSKILYRDAIWRLRQTLKEIDFNCVTFLRAMLLLDVTNIRCDYYDYFDKKKIYHDEKLLVNYDWSLDYQSALKYR